MIKYFYRVFFTIFIPFVLVLCAYIYMSYSSAVENAELNYKETLRTYWNIVSKFDLSDNEKLYKELGDISSKSDIRITLIDRSGKVLYDTSFSKADTQKLDNHFKRQEVRESIYKHDGYFSIRKSESTGKYSIYYSAMLDDNYVLRVASDGNLFHSIYSRAKADLITFVIVYGILFMIISLYISYRLVKPAIQLSKVAYAVTSNDESFVMPHISDTVMNEAAGVIYDINRKLAYEKQNLEIESATLSSIINHIDEAVIFFNEKNQVIKSNDHAVEIFNGGIKEGSEPCLDKNDYDLSVFFQEVLSGVEGEFKLVYKNRLYEIYTRSVQSNHLVVLRDVTAIADYEDFKSELTANIAHEIKTPVSIIMGTAETIIKDEQMPENIRNKFLEKIYTSSIRLNNIVNQTLELYKAERKGLVIEDKTNINDILSGIVIAGSDKEIIYNNKTERVYNIDSFHTEMILTNLINNAVKYSKGSKIEVDIYERDNGLIIEVADYGPAIPEKERRRIFERFYTMSKSRTKSGFGLGLSIVKHISRLYGGKAVVVENKNGGNTFCITLYEVKYGGEIEE